MTNYENLRPLGQRLLCKRVLEDKTKGGILLPPTSTERAMGKLAIVVAVGNGRQATPEQRAKLPSEMPHIPIGYPDAVKVGDFIAIKKFYAPSGDKTLSDDDLVLVHEDDVLAVVEMESVS